MRAHTMAEQAVVELQDAGVPGEYFVVVSLNNDTPVATQVVIVPADSETTSGS